MRFRRVGGSRIAADMARIRSELPSIVDVAFREFVSETPIRTGNARRSTSRQSNKIVANYNYANRLNAGWSRQSPDGMTDPTVDAIRQRVESILGNRGVRR